MNDLESLEKEELLKLLEPPKGIGGLAQRALEVRGMQRHIDTRYWELAQELGNMLLNVTDSSFDEQTQAAGVDAAVKFAKDIHRVMRVDEAALHGGCAHIIEEQIKLGISDVWVNQEQANLDAREAMSAPSFRSMRRESMAVDVLETRLVAAKDAMTSKPAEEPKP